MCALQLSRMMCALQLSRRVCALLGQPLRPCCAWPCCARHPSPCHLPNVKDTAQPGSKAMLKVCWPQPWRAAPTRMVGRATGVTLQAMVSPILMSVRPESAQMSPAWTSSTGTRLKLLYTNSSFTLAVRVLPGSREEQMATWGAARRGAQPCQHACCAL